MKEPVDHIERPTLPWRGGPSITECGYDATKVKTISRLQYFDRLRNLGQQRTAMITCMTCADTAKRWNTWEDDPRQALHREIVWERGEWHRARTDRGEQLRDELLAIERLITLHREDFDMFLKEIQGRREWLEKKLARRPPGKPRGDL